MFPMTVSVTNPFALVNIESIYLIFLISWENKGNCPPTWYYIRIGKSDYISTTKKLTMAVSEVIY